MNNVHVRKTYMQTRFVCVQFLSFKERLLQEILKVMFTGNEVEKRTPVIEMCMDPLIMSG